jgi:hypothetical protein
MAAQRRPSAVVGKRTKQPLKAKPSVRHSTMTWVVARLVRRGDQDARIATSGAGRPLWTSREWARRAVLGGADRLQQARKPLLDPPALCTDVGGAHAPVARTPVGKQVLEREPSVAVRKSSCKSAARDSSVSSGRGWRVAPRLASWRRPTAERSRTSHGVDHAWRLAERARPSARLGAAGAVA